MCHLLVILLEVMLVLLKDIFKELSLLGTFPLPPPDSRHVSPINMISSIGHLFGSYYLLVIPNPS